MVIVVQLFPIVKPKVTLVISTTKSSFASNSLSSIIEIFIHSVEPSAEPLENVSKEELSVKSELFAVPKCQNIIIIMMLGKIELHQKSLAIYCST